jgi:polysaccharide export outer membrane protein
VTLKKLRIAPCLAASLALAGCSGLIPGLNIDERSNGGHNYQIVESENGVGYKALPANGQADYNIVPITADVVAGLSTAGTDAPPTVESLTSLDPNAIPPEYKVGPGDVLFITVWDHPELTAAVAGQIHDFVNEGRLVASNGTIFYPYAGVLQVGGHTAAEIRQQITQGIVRVIQQPQVDVRVVSFRSQRINVTGEVINPGVVTLDDSPTGILQAIAKANGLTPLASRRRVQLVRDGKTYTIDLAGLLTGTRPSANIALHAGDSIHVPDQSGDQVFVLGAVQKQEPVVMTQDSTSLIQALTTAGGLDTLRGRDSGVLVFRLSGETADHKAIVYVLDMSNPQGILLAGGFSLRPRDVVYVKATAFSQYNSVVTQLLPTVQTLYDAVSANYLVRNAK